MGDVSVKGVSSVDGCLFYFWGDGWRRRGAVFFLGPMRSIYGKNIIV